MEEVTSNMTIAVMMMYLACHEVEWKCTNIKSSPIFCDSGIHAAACCASGCLSACGMMLERAS